MEWFTAALYLQYNKISYFMYVFGENTEEDWMICLLKIFTIDPFVSED